MKNKRYIFQRYFGFGIKVAMAKVLMHFAGRKNEKVREYYHETILKWLSKCLHPELLNMRKIKFEGTAKISKDCCIWVYWKQGFENAHEIIQCCLLSIRRNAQEHPVIALSDDNMGKYIQLPKIFQKRYEEGKMTIAHYSDCLRMELLSKYGGVWMDATLFMASPFDESIYDKSWYAIKNIRKRDKDWMNVANHRWSLFFMAVGKGEETVVKLLRDLLIAYYERMKGVIIDYFLLDYLLELLYQTNPYVKEQVDAVPDNNENWDKFFARLTEDFTKMGWEELRQGTQIFKLSYKNMPDCFSEDSFYSKVVRKNNNEK